MLSGMYKIAAGAQQEQQRQTSIARNLAGSAIAGYRREFLHTVGFGNAMNQAVVRRTEMRVDHRQGGLRVTDRPLDFALAGPGFFVCEGPGGRELLTRNGSFRLAPDGQLTTGEGLPVVGAGGPLRIPGHVNPADLQLSEAGDLVAETAAGRVVIGRLRVVEVDRPDDLERLSANYFDPGRTPLHEGGETRVTHRALEISNVSPLMEMADMIESMREFETAYNMVRMTDEIMRRQMENQ